MRKDLKYILILSGAVLLFIVMEIITPKPIDWTVSLSDDDKDPFGAYLIDKRLGDLFEKVSKSNLTAYELQDSVQANLLVLSQMFNPGEEDTETILNLASRGRNVFIASNQFYGKFADTLSVATGDYLFQGDLFQNLNREDTAALTFVNTSLAGNEYYYQRNNSQNYFSRFDSLKTIILGVNDLDRPTFVKINHGKGNIFLCATPLVFTNNYLVYQQNSEYISKALSYLPPEAIHWTAYYQQGRMEARTPLRYILSEEGLRWAYYIAIVSLLIFMTFEAKRKQRIIPIIEPRRNDTLELVGTIGNLYYQNKAHKSIAEKKINFFMEQLRSRYFITLHEIDSDLISKVAHKTGNDTSVVQDLFDDIQQVKKKPKISQDELLALNKKIESFKMN